jgi:hypothetical protein
MITFIKYLRHLHNICSVLEYIEFRVHFYSTDYKYIEKYINICTPCQSRVEKKVEKG